MTCASWWGAEARRICECDVVVPAAPDRYFQIQLAVTIRTFHDVGGGEPTIMDNLNLKTVTSNAQLHSLGNFRHVGALQVALHGHHGVGADGGLPEQSTHRHPGRQDWHVRARGCRSCSTSCAFHAPPISTRHRRVVAVISRRDLYCREAPGVSCSIDIPAVIATVPAHADLAGAERLRCAAVTRRSTSRARSLPDPSNDNRLRHRRVERHDRRRLRANRRAPRRLEGAGRHRSRAAQRAGSSTTT